MSTPSNLELIRQVADLLTVGIGIFHVPDPKDIKNVEYVYMNPVILYEMRKTKEEVFGKKIIEVAPEAYEHEGGLMVIKTYAKVAEEGGVVNLGLVNYSNHMVSGTYECTVHGIQKNYVYVQLRNVTELELAKIELEKKYELEKKFKELEQFNQITYHDLQEPLTLIHTYADLLEREEPQLSEVGQRSIEVFKESANRMTNYLIALRAYSQVGKEKEKSEIRIEQLLNQIIHDLGPTISDQNGKCAYIGNPLKIVAFKTDLITLFRNLILNGLIFSKPEESPVIEINSKEYTDHYEFSVKDNGIGIEKSKYGRIFEVFRRLDSRNEHQGSGMGLALCRRIVQLHNGEIWPISKVGEGTTFFFTISKSK